MLAPFPHKLAESRLLKGRMVKTVSRWKTPQINRTQLNSESCRTPGLRFVYWATFIGEPALRIVTSLEARGEVGWWPLRGGNPRNCGISVWDEHPDVTELFSGNFLKNYGVMFLWVSFLLFCLGGYFERRADECVMEVNIVTVEKQHWRIKLGRLSL